MSLWTGLQGLIDFLLLCVAAYFIVRLRKESRLRNEDDRRIEELSELRNSIDRLLIEALEISGKISQDIERKCALVSELSEKFDREKKAMSQLTDGLKSDKPRLKEVPGDTGKLGSEDRYSEALQLAAKGLSPSKISEKVNIPVGEIELVLSLRK